MYTERQAKALASQIHTRFGADIDAATNGTQISPAFLAGLISCEAGKDRKGQIKPAATRFEPHVYAKLQKLRAGTIRTYNQITRSQILDATDESLKALATSYGLCQIMGWHAINTLHCTVADLKDESKHLHLAVKMLELTAGAYLPDEPSKAMRIWNTGRPDGVTYHADYTANAKAVRDAYEKLTIKDLATSSALASDTPATLNPPVDVANRPQAEPEPQAATILQNSPEPQTASVTEPEPYNKIGFWATIKRDLVTATGGNLTFAGASEYIQQASGWPEWIVALVSKLAVGVLIFTFGWFVFRAIHFIVDSYKQQHRIKLESTGTVFTKAGE